LQEKETRKRRTIKTFCLILLFGTLAEFVARGPLRAVSVSSDFAVPYLAARAWRTGDNPYDHDTLDRIWREAGGEQGKKPVKTTTPSVYPPTTLILLAPLTFWSWKAARYSLLIINITLTILVIRLLLSIAQFDTGDWRIILFWAIALGFAPLHTGIALGNLAVPSASLALLAVWASSAKKDCIAGLLLALALSLKPQIGGIVWLGCVLQRRWRICAIAAAASLLLALIAIGRLELGQVDWVNSWVANYHDFVAEGRSNDPTASNVSRHHLLNLQWLLHIFLEQRWLVNLLVLGFVGSQFAVLWAANNKRVAPQNNLLFFSALIVLSLLATYHRFYDATLLILPLLWSLMAWSSVRKREARLSLLLIVPFLVPGAVILKELIGSGYLPCAWELSWWWNGIVMPHQVWSLAGLSICLTYALVVKAGNLPEEENYGHSAS
jgi:Glycosyltransferase family 87